MHGMQVTGLPPPPRVCTYRFNEFHHAVASFQATSAEVSAAKAPLHAQGRYMKVVKSAKQSGAPYLPGHSHELLQPKSVDVPRIAHGSVAGTSSQMPHARSAAAETEHRHLGAFRCIAGRVHALPDQRTTTRIELP